MNSKVIRVPGDDQYWKAVDVLAELQNMSLGEFTKAAIDAAYGRHLDRLDAFAASNVANQKQQLQSEANNA